MPLQPGDRAPELTLPSHTRESVALADLWNGQPLVVLFFPLAFTSTCTEELCTIGEDMSAYQEMSANVVAISVDSPWTLDRFRQECGADFPFLSDFNREASQAFGVLRTSPLGPGLLHVSDRSVFVVDPQGTIRYTWFGGANPGLLPPFDEIKQAVGEAA